MRHPRGYAPPATPGDEFAYAEEFTRLLRSFTPAVAAVLAHDNVARHPEHWKDA